MTAEQMAAVSANGFSVALASGAGCGKTTVLVRRYLAMLEGDAPLPLSRVVALTFTNKAARELRQRIRDAASQRAENADDRVYWRGIVRDFDQAKIGTIHSFCGDLLRRFAIEAGVDPGFEVLDEIIAPTLHEKTLDACLRRWLASQDPDFAALAVDHGMNSVRDALADILKSRPSIDLEEWASLSALEVVARWEQVRDAAMKALVQEFSDAQQETLEYLKVHSCTNEKLGTRCQRLIAEVPFLSQLTRPIPALLELRELAKVVGSKMTD